MTIGILKEPDTETRVSLLPEAAASLTKQNIIVQLEKDAGVLAYASDELYQTKNIAAIDRLQVLSVSDIILSIHPLQAQDIHQLRTNTILIGVYYPLLNYNLMKEWAEKNITAFSLGMMPRVTRAQRIDVLSSQANIAGYKAVLEAGKPIFKNTLRIINDHFFSYHWFNSSLNCLIFFKNNFMNFS